MFFRLLCKKHKISGTPVDNWPKIGRIHGSPGVDVCRKAASAAGDLLFDNLVVNLSYIFYRSSQEIVFGGYGILTKISYLLIKHFQLAH